MTTMNVLQPNFIGIPPAMQRAQTAMQLPEVQAMLRRLSEFDLGIFVPHRHDEQTGDFLPLPDDVLQVELGCQVSFRSRDEIAYLPEQFLPVAWRWCDGALANASLCEMVTEEGTGGTGKLSKHKMPNTHCARDAS